MSRRLAVPVVALLAACAGGGTSDDTDSDAATSDCPPAGTVETLATGIVGGTEGLTLAPDGTLYAVASSQLVTIADDGTVTQVATTPAGVGAAWWNDAVWVASWEDDEGEDEGALVEVMPDGTATRSVTPDIAKPNFLTPTPWGTLLVSDDFDTRIFEVTSDGTTTEWATDVPSPNGMGFSPDGATLYVVSTFTADPPLSAIAVDGEAAGAREVLHSFASGSAPDGLVVGADGSVFVAVNLAGRVDVWKDGAVTTLADGLDTPASLAFLDGDDACTLAVTSLFGETVSTVTTGTKAP